MDNKSKLPCISSKYLIGAIVLIFMFVMSMVYVADSYASTIVLPDSLQTIEEEAFYGDKSLEKIVIPNGITSIGKKAFSGSSTKSIYLPASIKNIGDNAFQNCPSLVCSVIPGTYAEKYCRDNMIPYITFETSISEFEYEQISGRNAKITKYNGNSKTITIPDTIGDLRITAIDRSVFMGNTELTVIVLPCYLEEICASQFSGCSNLSTVIMHENLKVISGSAFYHCKNLTSVFDSIYDISLEEIGANAFSGCTDLKTANLPDTVASIGVGAFADCTSLESFHYPLSWNTVDSSTYVVSGIFQGCKKLKTITVPSGVTEIPSFAFAYSDYLLNVFLPETVQRIKSSAFYHSSSLNEFVFPQSILYIDGSAFADCPWLNNLDSLSNTSLKEIGVNAFSGCSNLQTANLPDTVTSIGVGTFANCTSLKSFHYPLSWNTVDSSTYVVSGIFQGCKKLKTITVPSGVTEIPSFAFAYSDYLLNVFLPETVQRIKSSAFYHSSSLNEFVFPQSILYIDGSAFADCPWLNNLDSLSNTSLKKIGVNAFSGCSNLQTANLPDTVTSIGVGTFANCTSLKSFHYPLSWNTVDSSTYVVSGIFQGCKKLKTITVPYGVTEIPYFAFAYCDYLLEIHLPFSVTSIGGCAFYNDKSLSYIYLSENISNIGSDILTNCNNVTVYCEWGTYALEYVKNNRINYYYLSRTGAYSLNGANWPTGKLYQGDEYIFNGYVRSSVNISNVNATIWEQNTNTVKRSYSITPSVTDYGLQSALTSAMNIEGLGLGKYHFRLEAASNGIHEILVDTYFEIVPAPLRINVWDMITPEGYTTPNFSLSGTLRANYTISSVTIDVLNTYQSKIASNTFYPNALNFNLSSVSSYYNFSSFPRNQELQFSISIRTSAGSIDQIVYKTFIISENNTQYTNEQYSAIVRFATQKNNYNLFDKAYSFAADYLREEVDDVSDAWIIALNDYKDIVWSEITEFLGGDNRYLVNLYKGQITATLKDITSHSYTQYDKNHIAVQLADWIGGAGGAAMKTAKIDLPDETWKRLEPVCDSFDPLIKVFSQVKDSTDLANQLLNNIALLGANNFVEVSILESVRDSLTIGTNTTDKAFMKAMDEVYEEYIGELLAVLQPIIDKTVKELKKWAVKEAITFLISKNAASAYSVGKFTLKLCNKVAGFDTIAKTKKDFLSGFQNCSKASRAYKEAFNKVANGDDSSAAINSLYLNYCYARSSWRNMMDFLKKNCYTNPSVYFDEAHTKLKNLKFPGIEY